MLRCKEIIQMIRVCDTCDSTDNVQKNIVSNGFYTKELHLCTKCSKVLLNSNILNKSL